MESLLKKLLTANMVDREEDGVRVASPSRMDHGASGGRSAEAPWVNKLV